mmetsp:Transcript_7682/g.21375  ORF Transcript_7682/g.21375 Transcript_7682/m.21375 type:complete len:812 (+) Transcript_7682:46-2481(+)
MTTMPSMIHFVSCVILLWSSLPYHVHRAAAASTDEGDSSNPYVYSKMAALTSDPLLANLTEAQRQELEEKFGRWRFWDGDEESRPKEDALAKFPNRDMPGEDMPEEMWQADAVFVNHILNDAEKLVSRAMEAIFSDYGRGKPQPPEGYTQRIQMFKMERVDLATQTTPPEDYVPRTGQRSKGGWTTTKSFDGLVRRLLHVIQTNDEFVVVLGGDAAAAGHGNHFRQSYLMEFHRILAPVLARMGVKLVTRNLSVGHGLGTVQSSLGFSSLYGQDIDVLIWDCGMTESSDPKYADLFFRQGLMSQKRTGKVPFLMLGGNSNSDGLFQLLRWLHNEADINVGQLGTATFSLPQTESVDQAQSLPKALQFVNCASGAHEACQENLHCTHCWIDRSDIPDPKKLFADLAMSEKDKATATTPSDGSHDNTQRFWYPGWRQQLLLGRNLAYAILDALQDAVQIFSSDTMGGPPLEDEEWHVTGLYDNMRDKLKTLLAQTDGDDAKRCYALATEAGLPPRICNVPMQGATQMTPRPFPNETSIAALLPTDDSSKIPSNPQTVQYPGQDVHNDCMDIHDVDVPQVVSLRRRQLKEDMQALDTFHQEEDLYAAMPPRFRAIHQSRRVREEAQHIFQTSRSLAASATTPLGSGWQIRGEKPGQCDGEYLSICGRESTNPCPLLGHHDSRGEIVGTDASGWLVLNLPNVKERIVAVTIAFYEAPETSTNRELASLDRKLLASVVPTNDDFRFEFAFDGGEVTSWDKTKMAEKLKTVIRKVETVTLLDDTASADEATTMQVAMRIKGCSTSSCLFAISHVYWA